MTRIHPVNQNTADLATQQLLASVQKRMGRVPNLISTMAHSPSVAKAYLAFGQALAADTLAPRLREQIALVVAEFAERILAGRSIPEGLSAVEHHLALCAECREEYEVLRRALQQLDG